MSVVERLRVLRVPSPLVRPFVTAVRRTDRLDVVLVEATDADGRVGWGEAATSWRVTGESAPSVAAAVAGPLGDAVLGREAGDPALAADIAASVWGNAAARSAVECAVADLAARERGSSVAGLLRRDGTAAPSRLRTDMTLSTAAPAELAARAEEHVAAGFGCLKIKASAAQDTVAGLRAVRAAVGPAITLRIDANQAWDAESAIRVIRALEDAGLEIEFVEQPVAAHDIDDLAAVAAAVDTPIMADESVRTARDVRMIADRGAAALVNLKLAKTGGLAEAVVAAEAARVAGLGVVIGCMMESHVGVTAAAHLASAVAPDVVHDMDAALWLRRSPVVGGIRSEAGVIALGAGPGFRIDALAADAEPDVLADIRVRAGVRA
ncbi:mandelate racemase/muconate lactonizing enzyme family protein [Microbacterium sp. EST19A]|uniref:mandelate racemase/muconate lactonizing enzyme family protein n=1 Tax=Microbacterium sp. EST19A TaxID=2862681 RepID=UPI001CC1823A|nr:enolase C-terminal domain-like protein [Microbacterium sp. EST19A]